MTYQVFDKVTPDCHPAASVAYGYLETICSKDLKRFAAFLAPHTKAPFFANLPGGVQVTDVNQFIEMHRGFFASERSGFQYRSVSHGVADGQFFLCSVQAFVTLPNGSEREVYIDMTLFLCQELWLPRRFINTVIQASQAVLSHL
jgi:hypothetical protein